MNRKKQRVLTDLGPAERMQHGDDWRDEPLDTRPGGPKRRRILTAIPLDRFFHKKLLTRRQFEAGERLRLLHQRGAGSGRVTADLQPRTSAGRREMSDGQAAAWADYVRACKALGRLSPAVVAVVIHDEAPNDWARRTMDAGRAGMTLLRLGLDQLADFWGIPVD